MADDLSLKSFTTINPADYKGNFARFMFDSLLFKQVAFCLYFGSLASESDKETLRRFDHAVKMLEAYVINHIDTNYTNNLKSILAHQSQNQMEPYEFIRGRFILLIQVLNNLPDVMPEERAVDVIGKPESIESEQSDA